MAKRDLTGKTIIITGASSGIGAATALACARAGMDVTLAARREDKLAQVAQRVRELGRRALTVRCDVRRDEDVQRVFDETLATFGRIDAVFANAGYALFAPVVDTSDTQAREMFETNFFGTIRCVRLAVQFMREHRPADGGHILICSSAMSEIALPMFGFYGASKAAQDSIAGALRCEVKCDNIAVSSVHPIGTHSEFFEVVSQLSPKPSNGMKTTLNTPAMFMQTPERVARAIVRCLRKPHPEVWPSVMTRFGLALTTAFPRISARVQQHMMDHRIG